MAQVRATLPEGIHLVEEQHTRRPPTSLRKQRAQVAFAVAEPHVKDVRQLDRQKRRAELARDRTCEERLAAPWGAVEQQTTAKRRAVCATKLLVAERFEE